MGQDRVLGEDEQARSHAHGRELRGRRKGRVLEADLLHLSVEQVGVVGVQDERVALVDLLHHYHVVVLAVRHGLAQALRLVVEGVARTKVLEQPQESSTVHAQHETNQDREGEVERERELDGVQDGGGRVVREVREGEGGPRGLVQVGAGGQEDQEGRTKEEAAGADQAGQALVRQPGDARARVEGEEL